jgi:ADP-heptose:LPS heptosyltransferase
LASIDPRLDGARPVLLCPHSRGPEKDWPGFAALADRLCRDRPDIDIVWDSEVATAGPPPATGPRFIDTAGRTGLANLIALVATARLVVANDSGPMHLAAALGRPVIALFGPSAPARFGPYPPDRPGHHVIVAPDGDLRRLDVDTVCKIVTDALEADPAIVAPESRQRTKPE